LKFELYLQIFEKFPTTRFQGSLSSGRRVAPCGQKDGQTDMAKLMVVFHKFANACKNDSTMLV